ncbi:hypothetical protein [Caulobacter sp. CCH9-E1]|jgi:hypothetical protein|uniref:hypothetical protein n=1 Tax=Caulobacter sp. CCH9-E1 TaxID=1768768 RepID=UPI000830BD71|nr:hypothetical protein [Caulobacter sp. CCH9-E1]
MPLRRLAPVAVLLISIAASQTGCVAAAVAGTAIGVTGAVVGGAAKVGGKAVGAAGRAVIPGDSREDKDER